jgi:outer membrane lipoprotein SlyB
MHKGSLTVAVVMLAWVGCRTSGSQSSDFVSLTVSSGTARPGSVVTLDMNLNSNRGTRPATVKWSFVYVPSDIAQLSVAASPQISSAGKRIDCRDTPGKTTCIAWGLNGDPIQSGLLARAAVTLGTRTDAPTTTVALADATAASSDAKPIMTVASGATIRILR